jgi:hypothetical protein
MKILDRIKSFLEPKYKREANTVIEFAFSIGGIDYFQCGAGEFTNMPFNRAEKAMVFYEELKANIDYNYLLWITNEIEALLDKGKLTKVASLVSLLKERLNLAPEPDLVLKLASVMYFDNNESIYDYDFAYNKKKIANWKTNKLDAFFLKMPIEKLLPHIDFSKIDSIQMKEAMLATSATTVRLMDNLLEGEYSPNLTEDSKNKYLSARQSALDYLNLEGLDYMNIISALRAQNLKTE